MRELWLTGSAQPDRTSHEQQTRKNCPVLRGASPNRSRRLSRTTPNRERANLAARQKRRSVIRSAWCVPLAPASIPTARLVNSPAVRSHILAALINNRKSEVVRWRWSIEVFHKSLKSGCQAEHSKLRTAARLVNSSATFCILSWSISWLTMLNRSTQKCTRRNRICAA